MLRKLKLFALEGTKEFGQEVSDVLGIPLSQHEEFYFDDRESYCASLEKRSPDRGADGYSVSYMQIIANQLMIN